MLSYYPKKEVVIMSNSEWVKDELHQLFCGSPSLSDIDNSIRSKIARFNGKLYKYCSFSDNDSNHSLGNLKDGILYFQEPSRFNDPFDCALGFSVDEAFKALIPNFINDKINLEGANQELVKSATIAILSGKKEFPNTDNPMLAVISELFSNQRMHNLLTKLTKGEYVEDSEFVTTMFEELYNGNLSLNFLQQFANAKLNLQDSSQSKNFKLVLETILNNPSLLNLYNKDELNLEQTDDANAIVDVLKKDSITERIEHLCDMTGEGKKVREDIADLNRKLDTIVPQIKEVINKNFAISCFSNSPNNVLMWSHYADKHTGFCVEYDFSKIKDKRKLLLLFPAIYTVERPSIPLSMFDMSNPNDIKVSLTKEATSDICYALLCKSKYWNYENEWRILCLKNDLNNQVLYEDLAVKVYLGANISEDNKRKLLEIIDAKSTNIEIVQYRLDNSKFELREII